MTPVNRFIGSPVERVEDPRFLSGRGEYVGDIVRPLMLHAAIVRSPFAHGRIRALDPAPALAVPGVRGVITAAEIREAIGEVPRIPLRLQASPATEPFRQPIVAADRVRYAGEPIAVVLADSAALAEDGVEAIGLDLDELPAVADSSTSERGQTLLFAEAGSNLAMRFTALRGDAEAAFRDAEYTRRARFGVQRHAALPMEPRGLLAEWDAVSGRLTVMGAAKVPFFNRRTLAAMLGLPEEAVDLIENDVGGGFGARGEFYPEDFLIPFAARHTGRPVKWIEDRREHLIASNHARQMDCDVEIACRRDGTILGLRGEVFVDLGAYIRTNGLTAPRNVAQFFSGPYRIPNIRLGASALVTNKTPTGTYRAPGRYEGSFFCERLIELAAGDLGIDPVEMRRKNLVADAEMPYRLARIEPGDLYTETECDSGDYRHALDRCLAEFEWDAKRRLNGKRIDGRWHGTAVACFIEGGGAGPKELARLRLERDGRVTVAVGSASVGQGLETVMAQIAADSLGLAIDRIVVRHGSTTLLEDGYGAFHSRSTVLGGSAVYEAAALLRDRIRIAAAWRLGCEPAEIALDDGTASAGPGRSLDFAALAEDGLVADYSFENGHRHTYAYGAAAAQVAVDAATGRVELVDCLVVEDVGRIVNPLTLNGQIVGAVVQGLGGAILEDLAYDELGQPLCGTLADYLIPSASDFPRIRALALEHRPSPLNPLGVKGAGEGGIIPIGGLIANAVAAALSTFGAAPDHLPLSPPVVWRLAHPTRG